MDVAVPASLIWRVDGNCLPTTSPTSTSPCRGRGSFCSQAYPDTSRKPLGQTFAFVNFVKELPPRDVGDAVEVVGSCSAAVATRSVALVRDRLVAARGGRVDTPAPGGSWAAASEGAMLRPPGALAQGTAQGTKVSGGRRLTVQGQARVHGTTNLQMERLRLRNQLSPRN